MAARCWRETVCFPDHHGFLLFSLGLAIVPTTVPLKGQLHKEIAGWASNMKSVKLLLQQNTTNKKPYKYRTAVEVGLTDMYPQRGGQSPRALWATPEIPPFCLCTLIC